MPPGMIVKAGRHEKLDYQAMQMAHTLAGCVQARVRAEDAHRISGCANGEDDMETWKHITQASLMAFARINCRSAADELALISRVAQEANRPGEGRAGTAPPKRAGSPPEGPVRIEAPGTGDVASAVELVRRVLRVHPGDLGEQFASDITDDSRHMFVAKTNSQVIAYGRAAKLAAGEAAAVIPAGYYLSGVLVDPAWRGRVSPRR